MKRRFWGSLIRSVFLIFLSLSLVSVVLAEESRTLHFTDATGNNIENVLAQITLVDTTTEQEIKRILFVEEGEISITLPDATYEGTIILDDPTTDAADYFFSGTLVIQEQDVDVIFIPIAQIQGSVYDTLDNLVSKASLAITCDKLSTITFPEKTDRYGLFTTYVPIGSCTFAATNNKFIGKETITTEQGASVELTVTLDQQSSAGNNLLLFFIILVILIVVGYVLSKKYKRKPKKQKKPEKVNKKLDSILKTLNEKEQKIVQYVLNNKKVTAAQIRHGVGVPKTSLTRILDKLEEKKVITIERDGKRKDVQLADWLKN